MEDTLPKNTSSSESLETCLAAQHGAAFCLASCRLQRLNLISKLPSTYMFRGGMPKSFVLYS